MGRHPPLYSWSAYFCSALRCASSEESAQSHSELCSALIPQASDKGCKCSIPGILCGSMRTLVAGGKDRYHGSSLFRSVAKRAYDGTVRISISSQKKKNQKLVAVAKC